MSHVPLVLAFTAGLVSFAAPCLLPIIPGFLTYLAGTSLEDAKTRRLTIFLNSLFFVLGFSVVFAALGVLLNTLLSAIAYDALQWISRIGGVFVVLFGLYLTGLIPVPFLEREYKFAIRQRFSSRYLTSFVFGAAFAAGWTPCVGAVLGAILGLAVSQPGSAFILLTTYALGLGVPFLIVGLFAEPAARFINRFGDRVRYINILFGLLLVGVGILIFTQRLSRFANLDLLTKLFFE